MNTKVFTYTDLVDYIVKEGAISSPRGIITHEIRGCTLSFESGLMIQRKGINHRLALLESAMLLGGMFDIELIKKVAPKANHALYEKQSDYGTRLVGQYQRTLDFLNSDYDTRRAVLFFNNRDQDATDIACTTSMQFFYERHRRRLNAIVNIRSWDAVYGLPMDIVMYSSLLQFFSNFLGAFDGRIIANVGSLHVYETTKHLGCETGKSIDCMLDWNSATVEDAVDSYKRHSIAMSEDSTPLPKSLENFRYHGFKLSEVYVTSPLDLIEFTKIRF